MLINHDSFNTAEPKNKISHYRMPLICIIISMVFYLLKPIIDYIFKHKQIVDWSILNWSFLISVVIALAPFIISAIRKANYLIIGDTIYYNIKNPELHEIDELQTNLIFQMDIASKRSTNFMKIDYIEFYDYYQNTKELQNQSIDCYINNSKCNYFISSSENLNSITVIIKIYYNINQLKNNLIYLNIESYQNIKHFSKKYKLDLSYIYYFDKLNNKLNIIGNKFEPDENYNKYLNKYLHGDNQRIDISE